MMNSIDLLKQLLNFIDDLNLPDKNHLDQFINNLTTNEELLNNFHVTILSVSIHAQAFYRSITEKDHSLQLIAPEVNALSQEIIPFLLTDPITGSAVTYPNDEEIEISAITLAKILLNSPLEGQFHMNSADDIAGIINQLIWKSITFNDCKRNIAEKVEIFYELLNRLCDENILDFEKMCQAILSNFEKNGFLPANISEEAKNEIKTRFYSTENPLLIDPFGGFGQQLGNIVTPLSICVPQKKFFFDQQTLTPFDEVKLIDVHAFLASTQLENDGKLKVLNFEKSFSLAILLQNLIVRLDNEQHYTFIQKIEQDIIELALNYRNEMLNVLNFNADSISDSSDDKEKVKINPPQPSIVKKSDEAANLYINTLDEKIKNYGKQIMLSFYCYKIDELLKLHALNYNLASRIHFFDRHRDNAFLLCVGKALTHIGEKNKERCLTQPLLSFEEINAILKKFQSVLSRIEKNSQGSSLSYIVPDKLSKSKQSVKKELPNVKMLLRKIQEILPKSTVDNSLNNNNF
ncbi:MAG: hypothetical protein HKM04_00355 [Legionellales bacterium]|nr:hypothetical protein [Legionellales bacterium]